MSTYEFLTFLHVAAAIIWLGAGFLMAVLVLGAERAGDGMREAGYHRDVGWLAPRLFIPASFATLIFGILLVVDGSWTLDQLWIMIALVGWVISFGLGFFYFKPEGERIGAMAMERGPDDPEMRSRLRRLNLVDRVQVLLLFLIVADMVLKPTGQDDGLLIAGALILAAAIAAAVIAMRRDEPGAARAAAPAQPR
ncbi:MAG TPA: DUF2269 family protein [Solirubrobacterales bacterium]|nr:DUF2269 family protein [Solirubrobacterales bacterium]